jgi:hypothetical protein
MYTPQEQLIHELDNRYGNPHATDCKLIQQAIALLREQDEHIKELEKFIAVSALRQQADQLAKYKQVLESIANEYVELSHDKIKWQNEDHIKWAKEALK